MTGGWDGIGAPWAPALAGRWEEHAVHSAALQGNPLGDPARRPLLVYRPPGAEGPLPAVYVLQGLVGQLDQWRNRKGFAPTYLERVDALFAQGQVPPCLVVLVDGWSSWGGAQFLDTPAIGRYQTYLSQDVVAHVDATFETVPTAGGRAVAGHSSGGYGALVSGLFHPEVWGHVASHAGDCLFEVCYQPDIRQVARTLGQSYGGSYQAFWAEVRERGLLTRGDDFPLLNLWCMAACYSADDDRTVHLPFDEATGRMVPEIWARWLLWDPVRLVPHHVDAVRSWRSAWVDAGTRDEVFLDLGARALVEELRAAGLTEDRLRFELHGGGHGGQDERFILALTWLATRLDRG